MPTLQIDTRSGDFPTADLDKRRSGDRRFLFFATDIIRQIDQGGRLRLHHRPRNWNILAQ